VEEHPPLNDLAGGGNGQGVWAAFAGDISSPLPMLPMLSVLSVRVVRKVASR
jgi:hypothetical protein